jgi:hypothetical protein
MGIELRQPRKDMGKPCFLLSLPLLSLLSTFLSAYVIQLDLLKEPTFIPSPFKLMSQTETAALCLA